MIAIDLFCGLFQAKLLWRGDAFVQNFMACRAQNPNHMALAIGHQAPTPFPFVARAVCHLDNATFSACFARAREVGVFSSESSGYSVLIWTARVVDFLNFWILAMKGAALNFCRLSSAYIRAIALVAVRRRNVEVLSADAAIAPQLSDVRLFAPTKPSLAGLAAIRAIALIGAFRLKCGTAHCAE